MSDVERLLRSALVPVDPPGNLTDRFEQRLTELADAAAGELSDWELSAMRDPRNWGRPATAAVVGGLAGGALVLLRARQRQRHRHARRLEALERGARDLAAQARRRLDR
jgi:hypothetical protein